MPSIAEPPHATQERLATRVSELMRPGVITVGDGASLLQAKRALVRHGVHAILIVATESGLPLGWVTIDGLLGWLRRDLSAVPAAQAITEPPHFIEPGATAGDALEQLAKPGVSHLLVRPAQGGVPQGVVAATDLVDLLTHP